MKKGWKIFWISCGAVAAVGFVCCMAGAAMGVTFHTLNSYFPNGIGIVSDVSRDSYEDGETTGDVDVRETFSDIRQLDVEVTSVSVQILEADAGSHDIKMETAGVDSRYKLKYYVEDGGTLHIETGNNRALRNSSGTIWLYVPKDLLKEAELSVGAGELYVKNLYAEELSIEVGAGEATLDNFQCRDLDLSCGVGSVTMAGTFAENADVECGMGTVDFMAQGAETDYNYDIECGMGSVDIGDDSYGGIASNRSVDNQSAKSMNIDCGMGTVSVDFGIGL